MARKRSAHRSKANAPKNRPRERPASAEKSSAHPGADAPLAFVIMPFTTIGNLVFRRLIRPSAEAAGYRVERADTTLNQRAIMQDVIAFIQSADLVLADLTGRNANVFYELGVGHALQRRTLLLAQSTTDIPFDLAAYRAVIYSVEFDDAGVLVSNLVSELGPVLKAARADEILFSSPFADFGSLVDATEPDVPTEGILNMMQRFIKVDVPEATEATAALQPVIERATEAIKKVGEDHAVDPESGDLSDALELAGAMADVLTSSADELEPLVDERLIPAVLAVEKDIAGIIRAVRRAPGTDVSTFLAGLATLGATTSKYVQSLAGLASIIRTNSLWADSLLQPGERLASIYDRIAANVGRMGAVADSAASDLPQQPATE